MMMRPSQLGRAGHEHFSSFLLVVRPTHHAGTLLLAYEAAKQTKQDKMADNRLRCALVYRLDAGDETSVTMLAKYDHASQYETSPGGSDLYGGRDKSYADAVGMVIGNDPPGATSEAGTIGGFKVCQSEVHQVVYGSDTDGLCKSCGKTAHT